MEHNTIQLATLLLWLVPPIIGLYLVHRCEKLEKELKLKNKNVEKRPVSKVLSCEGRK
jgi:hypothetical protein